MVYLLSSGVTATLNLCLIYFKITWGLAILLDHMHKKFEINRTKIKGGWQSGRKVVAHNSKSDLPLEKFRKQIVSLFFRALRCAASKKSTWSLNTLQLFFKPNSLVIALQVVDRIDIYQKRRFFSAFCKRKFSMHLELFFFFTCHWLHKSDWMVGK